MVYIYLGRSSFLTVSGKRFRQLIFLLLEFFIFISKGTEAVVWGCSVEKVFLEISHNSEVFSCEFCEISKNIFFYKTPPVAAFEGIPVHIKLVMATSMAQKMKFSFKFVVVTQSAIKCSKLTIKTPERRHTLYYCFYC